MGGHWCVKWHNVEVLITHRLGRDKDTYFYIFLTERHRYTICYVICVYPWWEVITLQSFTINLRLTELSPDILHRWLRETAVSTKYSPTSLLLVLSSPILSVMRRLHKVSLESSVFKADWLTTGDIASCFWDSLFHADMRLVTDSGGLNVEIQRLNGYIQFCV